MVSSPLPRHYWNFQKEGNCAKLFMPTWSWEEMKTAREVVFPAYDEQRAKEDFLIAGGSIRLVLEQQSNNPTDLKTKMKSALDGSNTLEIMRAPGASHHGQAVSDQLVHYVQNPNPQLPPYTEYVLDWASK